MTTKDLALRAGISRGTLQKIEQGYLTCEIGLVFEVAMIVGVQLFETNAESIAQALGHTKSKMALMPLRIRQMEKDLDDNF